MGVRDGELAEDLLRMAARAGASDAHIEYGGKHPAIVGTIGGRRFRHAFPFSASDRRSGINCLCDFRRRLCDIHPPARAALYPEKKQPTEPARPRTPKRQPDPIDALPDLRVGNAADWRDVLLSLKKNEGEE